MYKRRTTNSIFKVEIKSRQSLRWAFVKKLQVFFFSASQKKLFKGSRCHLTVASMLCWWDCTDSSCLSQCAFLFFFFFYASYAKQFKSGAVTHLWWLWKPPPSSLLFGDNSDKITDRGFLGGGFWVLIRQFNGRPFLCLLTEKFEIVWTWRRFTSHSVQSLRSLIHVKQAAGQKCKRLIDMREKYCIPSRCYIWHHPF